MTTDAEREVLAVRPERPSRLTAWAVRRGRQALAVVVATASVVLVLAAGALLWRSVCLFNLPDVGDPFDVTQLSDKTIPADRDAFASFRQARAAEKLPPMQRLLPVGPIRGAWTATPVAEWSKVDPQTREWVAANRLTLDLLRKGADLPDGIADPVSGQVSAWQDYGRLRLYVTLMLLEGSRLEDQGDMPGAWGWYRTVLRFKAHYLRRGSLDERALAADGANPTGLRVAHWAADPKTTTVDLRRALDDVIATGPRPEWDASSLRVHYALGSTDLDFQGTLFTRGVENDKLEEVAGWPLHPALVQTASSLRRFLSREPERSRRVLRLAYANWLAHVQDPGPARRAPAVRVNFLQDRYQYSLGFYTAGPKAPAGARALAPRALAGWFLTTTDARNLLAQFPWPEVAVRERRDFHALVILLAEQLYRRERGESPRTDADLVGPYLKALPDDGSADLDDGTAPTVEDPRLSKSGSVQ